jgi:hypothetical protein
MGNRAKSGRDNLNGRSGYYSSAVVFAAITVAWAFIVRSDPYYRLVDIFGARIPLTMLFFVVLMPLAGLVIGLWRYEARHEGGALGYTGKLFARIVHFIYVHLLIVLFTVAMLTDHILGLNIDQQVRSLDDRMFDLAARFAPWLAAYLSGFNLGRAVRGGAMTLPAPSGVDVSFDADGADSGGPQKPEKKSRKKSRAEPVIEQAGSAADANVGPVLTASGLPAAGDEEIGDQPGFLPPQDLDKIRPTLRELR